VDSEKRSEIVEWISTVRRCLLRYIPLVACRWADVNDKIVLVQKIPFVIHHYPGTPVSP